MLLIRTAFIVLLAATSFSVVEQLKQKNDIFSL